MPPRRSGPPAPLAAHVAAGRSYSSELSLMVRQLGLWDQLDKDSRRQPRLVCRALCIEADALIDTLTLRLDDAACSSPAAAQRTAAFHRRCTAAQTLRVYMPGGGAPATSAMARFAEAYARAAGPLVAVQQCRVSHADCGRYPLAVLRSVLGALPQLQALSMNAPGHHCSKLQGLSPSSAAQLVSVLADCPQQHSLALRYSPRWIGYDCLLVALAQLTQLRALSFSGEISPEAHLPCLTRLTRLERLGVGDLISSRGDEAPSVQLPSVRTLSAAWTDPLLLPVCNPASYFTHSAGLDPAALDAFPNLQRVEHMRIPLRAQADRSAVHLPTLVQRLAGCADLWRLCIDATTYATLAQQLQPGSLAALRHLEIGCSAGSTPYEWHALLQLLLAAAPNIRSLGLYSLCLQPPPPVAATLLQPLKQAAQLQTLSLSILYGAAIGAPWLVAAVRFLAAPPPRESHAGGMHCAALSSVRVRGLVEGVVDAAAATLEESGCAIRLQQW